MDNLSEEKKYLLNIFKKFDQLKTKGFLSFDYSKELSSLIEKMYILCGEFFDSAYKNQLAFATQSIYTGYHSYVPEYTEGLIDFPAETFYYIPNLVEEKIQSLGLKLNVSCLYNLYCYFKNCMIDYLNLIMSFESTIIIDKITEILESNLVFRLRLCHSYVDNNLKKIDMANKGKKELIRHLPHTDFSVATILVPATSPGLQYLSEDNQWLDIKLNPSELLLMNGDKLSLITNGYFKSSYHRVISTTENFFTPRYSAAFFMFIE